jgi:hypothetical protein
MNKYTILLLILLTGFTPTDIRREIITLNWHFTNAPENKLGQTFSDAGYAFPGSQIPIFFKSFPVENKEQNFHFILENPQFEEVESHNLKLYFDEIPEKSEIKQTRLKSAETQKIEIQIPAIIRKGEKIFKLKQFALKQIPQQLKSAQVTTREWKTESVLNTGKWVKISTSGKGIYKLPYSKLTEYGFTNPSQVKVFGAGGMILSEDPGKIEFDDLPQLAVWHGRNNGTDCLFFYAPGTMEWNPSGFGEFFDHRINPYARKGHFFLSENNGTKKNIQPLPAISDSPTHSISSFNAFQIYKNEKINLIHSGKQWFSDKFINGTNKDYSFQLTDVENSSDVFIRVNAAARSSSNSEMPVKANQTNLGKINFNQVNTADNAGLFADGRSERFTFSAPTENLELKVQYFGSGSSPEAWLDYIEINYRRKLKTNNELLFFRDKKSVGQNNILEFSIETGTSDLKVWDVTDVFNVQEVPIQISNNKATGKRPAGSLKEYAAFSPNGNFPEPELIGEVENQNLHGISTPEFLIISHPIF